MRKNKKCIESTIGKIIYGTLLFIPLIAVATTCLIAIFNKNANIGTNDITTYSLLINSFENVMNHNLINWTTNTTIYTTINGAMANIGITYTPFASLLTYWFLMTIIYIIYDIALIMIQLAHKKVHELIEK